MKKQVVKQQTVTAKTGARYGGRFREEMNAAAKKSITKAFQETGGNVVRTAKLLGMSQPSLWKWCQKLGIDADDYRE